MGPTIGQLFFKNTIICFPYVINNVSNNKNTCTLKNNQVTKYPALTYCNKCCLQRQPDKVNLLGHNDKPLQKYSNLPN